MAFIAIRFLDWWNVQNYVTQQAFLANPSKRENDSNYSIAEVNQKAKPRRKAR